MAKHRISSPQPTAAELDILRVLWGRRRCTVREIHEALAQDRRDDNVRPVGYTTTLKFLQIMADKGLVARDETNRSHVYRATISEGDTQRHLLRNLLDRAFGGSMQKLVMRALSTQHATPEELAAIRKLIDDHQKKGKQP